MKKLLLPFICFLFISYQANSQVRTVSNNVNNPGQYSSLQTAINAANPGDTLYVHGSPSSYGDIIVNKRLTFIGPGFTPQSQFNNSAYISSIQLDSIIPTSSAIGSTFIGLSFGYINKKTTLFYRIDNILIEGCNISSNTKTFVNGNNWIIRNCYFNWSASNVSLDIDYYNNIIISNNIFLFSPENNPNVPAIINSNKSSVIINNNLFTGFHQGGSFSGISYAQFSNNIFFGKSPQGAYSSVFSNNICFANTQAFLPYGTNSGQNNKDTTDPKFVYVPLNYFSFSNSYDYHLNSLSPGKNAGTDSTDIGIYGGAFPMPTNNNKVTGESRLPQIYYMNILNNVIDENTPINVTVKARKMY